jgi:hypothetical protein
MVFSSELTHVGEYFAFHTGVAPKLSFQNGLGEVLTGVALLTVAVPHGGA